MAQPKYGSITIVDLNDKGQLSVFPTSNMPLSVIYDPKQNTYIPDWSVNNLILTPIIYYGNREVTAATSGVTVTWKRREGSGNVTELTTGETVFNGILTVSMNKFTPLSSMISYIVHVDYLDAETQTTLIAEGQITINLNKSGESGDNARLFELYTIGGNVFTTRESQDITIYGRLMDGSEEVTTTATDWIWSKWEDGAYVPIIGETDSYLVVNNSTVDGFGAYRATCQYDNTTFTGYYSLIDRLDPLQATAICSLGEQIINGQGVGALYVLVTDTGTGAEIDPLKSSRFLTSAPENPAIGDYYYYLDATNKNVVLKKYDGEKWIDAEDSEFPTGDYTWSFRDKNGNPTTLNKQSQIKGKVIYIDGTLINDKIIADVKAEVAKTTTYGSTTITSYNSIINTEVYYYKSSSATELIDGEWSIQQPEWEENKYIWQKIRTLYEDGTATESEAANISGQQGQSGISAISYKLNATQNIITKLNTGEYSINSITFNSTYKQGDTETSDYLGRFTIQHLSNNSEWIVDYISSINESTITYELLEDILAIRCLLYRGGGTDILLDLLTIPVIKESSDGKDATGLVDSLPIYLASNRNSEVKITDIGWTRYKPELTNDKRYLWSYQVLRYASGDSNPELIKLQGETIDFEYHGETSPLEEVIVDINFIQQGSGDPSPDNIRPITGWSAINISSSDISLQVYEDGKYQLMMSSAHGTVEENILQINDDNITIEDNIMTIKNTAPSYNIIFPASIGTVYKGYLNVTTGTLTVTYGYIDSYAGETIDGIWISDRDIYVEGTTPTIGAQVIYELSTPLTYKLTPQEILALSGANRIWADTGNMSISYYDDQKTTEPIIDQSLTSVIEMTQDVASKVMATYGESSSSAGDMIKVVDCENFELYEGARLQIAFENSNTVLDQLFLDVNNTGSKAIYVQNEPVSNTNQLIWGADTLMEFVYTNDGWHLQNAPFSLFGLSDTLANQTNKMVNCEHCIICKGTSLSVNMNHTNTVANATLNIDSTIPILIHANGQPLTTNSRFNWRANTTQKFVFDGQVWRMDDDSVKALATAYITEIDDDGIMVHPEDDNNSGWAISDTIQLFKNGISYIKLWIENNIPKIRIGKEDQGHIILDNDSVDIRNDDTVLASFGATSVIGDTNDWHQTIAANQITFAKGDNTITYISPDKLYTINAEVADAFYISNYSIRNASDGKLVIGLRR